MLAESETKMKTLRKQVGAFETSLIKMCAASESFSEAALLSLGKSEKFGIKALQHRQAARQAFSKESKHSALSILRSRSKELRSDIDTIVLKKIGKLKRRAQEREKLRKKIGRLKRQLERGSEEDAAKKESEIKTFETSFDSLDAQVMYELRQFESSQKKSLRRQQRALTLLLADFAKASLGAMQGDAPSLLSLTAPVEDEVAI